MQLIFSKAREVAHALIAIIGALAAAQGLVVTFVASLGVHVTALDISQKIGMAGLAAALFSKLIDSANNIFTGNTTPGSGQLPLATPQRAASSTVTPSSTV